MKKYYFFGIFLFFYGFAKGQIINFPDINFKNKLLSSSPTNEIAQDITNNSFAIDSNNNGEIEESEALMVYSLNVSNSNISSLQGLEYFTNLYFLYCYNNLLSDINLSNNINLVFINCNNNQLTTIDTSFINDLYMGISCNNNNLTSMNLKGIGDGWEIAIQGLTYA